MVGEKRMQIDLITRLKLEAKNEAYSMMTYGTLFERM